MSIFFPDGETRRGELRSTPAQLASSSPRTAEPAEVCEADFQVRRSRSYSGQILFKRSERVAITGRGRVLRNLESTRDFGKGELVPNLHYQHLALFVRQKIERGHERTLRFVLDLEQWLNCLIHFGNGSGFAASAPAVAPEKIESNGAHRCVKEAAIRDVMLFSPETDESFLDNVLRVGCRSRPLPREQQQAGRELGKAILPIFIGGDILHDLFTVFYNRDAANHGFCLTGLIFLRDPKRRFSLALDRQA